MKLLVLTQDNCRYCDMVKNYLVSKNVIFDVINLSTHPEYQDKYDVMGTPTILLMDGEEVVAKTYGFFNPETLDTFIDQLN